MGSSSMQRSYRNLIDIQLISTKHKLPLIRRAAIIIQIHPFKLPRKIYKKHNAGGIVLLLLVCSRERNLVPVYSLVSKSHSMRLCWRRIKLGMIFLGRVPSNITNIVPEIHQPICYLKYLIIIEDVLSHIYQIIHSHHPRTILLWRIKVV